MKIDEVPLDSIRPYSKNARVNANAIDGVAESIRRFGFKQPIVIDAANVIVAGHTRHAAARKLGLTTVPVVRADDLTPEQVRAYRLLDNKLAEASFWDFDVLGSELSELAEFDFSAFNVEFPTFETFGGDSETDGDAERDGSGGDGEPNPFADTDGEPFDDPAGAVYPDGLPSPFSWNGGKNRQRNNIYRIIKDVERSGFVEIFGGSGAIMLGKPEEPCEVYNDINRLLVAFFRVLKSKKKAAELKRLCDLSPPARVFYNEMRDVARAYVANDAVAVSSSKAVANLSEFPDDVAAAFAIFYCQNFSFGGKYLDSFCVSLGRGLAPTYRAKVDLIDDFVQRFKNVTVENMDWAECLKRYDRPDVLLYLDPPYECATADAYESGWTSNETRAFVDAVAAARGKIVVSCYDTPDFQKLRNAGFRVRHFHAWTSITPKKNKNIQRVETVYYKLAKNEIERIESELNRGDSAKNGAETDVSDDRTDAFD